MEHLKTDAVALRDAVQSISKTRFQEHLGTVPEVLMAELQVAQAAIESWA